MTEERKIQLIAEVDATGTRAGFNEIQREAGTMAASVQRSSQQAERAVAGVGNGAGNSARNVEAAQRNLIGSIQRTTASLEAGTRSGSAYYEVLARQRGVDPAVLAPYLAQLRAVEAAHLRTNAAVAGAVPALNRTGVSAAQTAAALRGVPAQFTDIVTSLQGGQAPITVLLQQGGQLKDMFGGAGNAAKALGGYVLGLVNPYTVAAAAGLGLAYAYHEGAAEAKAYNRAIIDSGNIAGATVDRLSETARRIGEIGGSRGAAAEAITGLVSTSKVSVDNMERFATVAIEAQRVLGRSLADTTAEFAELGKTPLAALTKIGDKYHFITAATYAQVKALQDQGRMVEAANVAQNAYADGITGQRQKVLDSLTDWERGWLRIKKAISGAIDATLDIGRGATGFEKLNSLLAQHDTIEANMARAKEMRDDKAAARWQALLDQNEKEIKGERAKGDAAKSRAKAESDANKADEARKKWLEDSDKYLTRQAQLEREITVARNEGAAANVSSLEIEKRVSDIRKKYADIYNDSIDSNIAALQRRLAMEDLLSKRAIDRISFQKNAGMINEEQAIERITDKELARFDAQRQGLVAQLGFIKQKQNSLKAQEEQQTKIEELDAQRARRKEQGADELFLLDQQRFRLAAENSANLFDQSMAERVGLVAQVQAQRDYNEEIGKTAEELLILTARRREDLAVRKDQDADIAEGLDLTGEKADGYRAQAAALRDRSAAEKEGFVKERDPWVNLRLSIKRYGDEADNVGGQIGAAMTNGFRSAEDALVAFVMTGKLNFKSLTTSILADFARIEAKRAFAGFVNMAVSSFFPGSGPGSTGWDGYGNTLAGARAGGGPVTGGLSYLVGEKGPEIFTPSGSGAITPNSQLGGGTQISIATYITDSGARTETTAGSGAQAREVADGLNAKMKAVIMQEMRQGGLLWNQQMRGAA